MGDSTNSNGAKTTTLTTPRSNTDERQATVWTITTALSNLPSFENKVVVVMPLLPDDTPLVFRTKMSAMMWGEREWIPAWRLLNQKDTPKLTPVPLWGEFKYIAITIEGFPVARKVPTEIETPESIAKGRLVTARLKVGVIQVGGQDV